MTREELLIHLTYRKDTGTFYWRKTLRRGFEGKRAGSYNKLGYETIRLFGKLHLTHRLVWLAETGSFPERHLDHINRIKSDNRFENLRECTRTENMRNTKRHQERLGYSYDRTHGKWKVYIDEPDKKRVNLGTVRTKEEAIALLESAKCKREPTLLWKQPSTPHLVFSFPC